ncbi:helix-turn-helix domain-containing protein [uncultured Psychroserpens sp.]|uniref:helix-turn-helix domain-containing protein n=1 Tax=uncultured Psychroserpens sp. TaxID=255436 RepID=UPI002634FA5B|nr:helix-turn-helix domain-containing protein [uncultured Psychroserpens sp.]
MNYRQEINYSEAINCYWESHDMASKSEYVYPSLPEPYINLFFPLELNFEAKVKGISWTYDYFKMHAKLFGVSLNLRGFLQLHLTKSIAISNKTLTLKEIGNYEEELLIAAIQNATSFDARIAVFKAYYEKKLEHPLSKHQTNLSNAFIYFLSAYENSRVIENYANHIAFTPRTINRWFVNEIGINPKKLSRVIRFHYALQALHSHNDKGFYLDYGYYDQAHFIKEFNEFTGNSPERYLKIVSDLYNIK